MGGWKLSGAAVGAGGLTAMAPRGLSLEPPNLFPWLGCYPALTPLGLRQLRMRGFDLETCQVQSLGHVGPEELGGGGAVAGKCFLPSLFPADLT